LHRCPGRRESEFGCNERRHHNEEDRDFSADQRAGGQVESDGRRRHLRLSLVQPRRRVDQRHRHQRSAHETTLLLRTERAIRKITQY